MKTGSAPDRWLVVEVAHPRDPDVAALLVEELLLDAERGVEERDDAFLLYISDPGESPEAIVESLRERLARTHGLDALAVTYRWQPHQAWGDLWRDGFSARRITPRLVVSPTWEDPSLEPGDVLVLLDPGMAFGTSQHPTTRGALRLLDSRVKPGDRVADVGAGSGILSIAAVLLGADHVTAVEMDPWSCVAARENARVNGVQDRIDVLELRIGPEFLPVHPPFDGIVANIESGVLLPLLESFRRGLLGSGWLILSGILEHESEAIVQHARESGFRYEGHDVEEGWWTGALRAEPRHLPPSSS